MSDDSPTFKSNGQNPFATPASQYHLNLQEQAEDQKAVLQHVHFMESTPHNGKCRCIFEASVALLSQHQLLPAFFEIEHLLAFIFRKKATYFIFMTSYA
jgi:hypothetical protein